MLPHCLGDINLLFTYGVTFLVSFSQGVLFSAAQANDATVTWSPGITGLSHFSFPTIQSVTHSGQLTYGAWETGPSGSDLRTQLCFSHVLPW